MHMQRHTQHFSYADIDNILYAESTNRLDFNTRKVNNWEHSLDCVLDTCSNRFTEPLVVSQQMLSAAVCIATSIRLLKIPIKSFLPITLHEVLDH